MGDIIEKDFKYKLVKNFLTKEEVELLTTYTVTYHRNNSNNIREDGITQLGETSEYGSCIMDSLMIGKLKKMEEITGKILLPTYSFWRMYVNQSSLPNHKDRPSCEISATIFLGSDGKSDWPIYIEANPIVTQPGDAVVYLGCVSEHWREKFTGDWSSHVFLHYVDKHGPNKKYEMDERKYIGRAKWT
jgi:hypothetical protein